jgi:hypothetical protein
MSYLTMVSSLFGRWMGHSPIPPSVHSHLATPGMCFNQRDLPDFVQNCPVAMKYKKLLGCLAWEHFPGRDESIPWPGNRPHSRIPYVAAFLIKIDQGLTSLGRLRTYLVEHPALSWLLGFPLTPAASSWGFDTQRDLPSSRHFSNILCNLPNVTLQFLLDETVRLLQSAAPQDHCFGDEVSLDTKHILAWVRENNPKEFVKDRFDKTKQPKGDPDCKLGCKERSNQRTYTPTTEGVPAETLSVGTFYWGYASGIVVTQIPKLGEVVLAEYTQPFNAGETTYFFPLMHQVERRLGRRPRFGALDAAFDAHYIYDYFHDAGGFAAVPLVKRGKAELYFNDEGLPLCEAGLAMPTKHIFWNRKGLVHQRQARHACPLLYPDITATHCPIQHSSWPKTGCVLTLGISPGARIRYQLDRNSQPFQHLYAKRTASERIFSQAKELGIERPKLRNQASIANLNTLTYVLLNLRTLQRATSQSPD